VESLAWVKWEKRRARAIWDIFTGLERNAKDQDGLARAIVDLTAGFSRELRLGELPAELSAKYQKAPHNRRHHCKRGWWPGTNSCRRGEKFDFESRRRVQDSDAPF